MSTSETEAGGGWRTWGPWAFLTFVVAAGLALFVVAKSDRSIEFKFFDRVGFAIAAPAEFFEVSKMLNDQPYDQEQVELELKKHDFYSIESGLLVDAIENIDSDGGTFETLRNGLRQILWSRTGPYSSGTLAGADGAFLGALLELDEALRQRQEVNELLTVLWERSIEQDAPFERLKLNANVSILPDTALTANRVFACPQNQILHGKYIKLLGPDNGPGQLELKIHADERFFACDRGPVSEMPDMLGGVPARLALSESTARHLLQPGRAGPIQAEPFEAKFYLRPAFLASAGALEALLQQQEG